MPALASNYNAILGAVQTIISALTLKDWNGNNLPIAVRKLPRSGETIDTPLPILCIVPKEKPPNRKPYTFGPFFKMTYPVEVVFVAAGNSDFTTNLNFYLGWLAEITSTFDLPAGIQATVPLVWDLNVVPDLVIDREEVNDDYDYGGLTIEVVTSEQ